MDWLGTQDTADFLHVPLATLRHWISTGQAPPSARIGKRRFFRRDDVIAWANAKFDAAAVS